jgi:quaternary ammonium compound-resistance protein SugE
MTAATASFFFPALALRALPIGTAYAIWVGIGIGGVAVFGAVALGEPASAGRMGFWH